MNKIINKFFLTDHKFMPGLHLKQKKTESGMSVNKQLAEELHKPAIKKLKRRKVYARFKDNIWSADLGEMESLSSCLLRVKMLNIYYVL